MITGILTAALTSALVFSIETTETANTFTHYCLTETQRSIDENQDGICDYAGSGACIDANGDGICDNYGSHTGCVYGAGNGNGAGNGGGGGYGHHGGNGGGHHGGRGR